MTGIARYPAFDVVLAKEVSDPPLTVLSSIDVAGQGRGEVCDAVDEGIAEQHGQSQEDQQGHERHDGDRPTATLDFPMLQCDYDRVEDQGDETADQSQEQQVAPESMSVHVFGNTAIATGVFRAKGVEGGKPYVRRERFVDTWVYTGGKWACVATDATPVLR